MPKQIDGVTPSVVETWLRRDYGLSSAELRAVIELRDGVCPLYQGTIRGITPRDVYLARVIRSLPEMAKPRCSKRATGYVSLVVRLLFPVMKKKLEIKEIKR